MCIESFFHANPYKGDSLAIMSWLSSTSNFMLVGSQTLTRLHKRKCLPEPSLIISVIRTSRAWYQLIWDSVQVDFMLGSELCSRKSTNIAVPSVSHLDWVFQIQEAINYRTILRTRTHMAVHLIFLMTVQNIRIGDFASTQRSLNLAFSEKILNVINVGHQCWRYVSELGR